MEVVISGVTAYVLIGFTQVAGDLAANPLNRPVWALNPSIPQMLLFALIWPLGSIGKSVQLAGQAARGIAFGVLGVVMQFTMLTTLIWGSYQVCGLIFDSLFLRLPLTALVSYFASLVVAPLATLLMMPVMLIISWPLDLLFPQKSR